MTAVGQLIAGAWRGSHDGRTITIENPARREAIAEVPRATGPDVDRAVRAATDAFPSWRRVPPRERGRALLRIADALDAASEDLARTIALVRKLSFTGSTEVGKIVMRAAADRIVPVSLELGGKSPSIVFPDADEAWVVDGVISGMRFTRQSQSCTAGSRLFVHEAIYDSFLEKLVAKVSALKLGDPLDEATDIGSLINEKQFKRVCSYLEDGLARRDARLLMGGLPPTDGPLARGYFTRPTIFAGVENGWRIAQEEIFGPVLCAIPWSDEAEVLKMANDSHYGLAAYVGTHDIGRALRMAHGIESGFVQVNQGFGQFPGQSYGGVKESGIGREFSLEGMLDSFTWRKSVTVNVDTPPARL